MNNTFLAAVVLSVRTMMNMMMKASFHLTLFLSLSPSLALSPSADGSSECSPRRRSISGGGASEKSVAVETSSPFKVPVRMKKRERESCDVSGPGIDETMKTDFLLRVFFSWSDQCIRSTQ